MTSDSGISGMHQRFPAVNNLVDLSLDLDDSGIAYSGDLDSFSTTPALTPQFSKPLLFDDIEMDYFTLRNSNSRSSSASVEDIRSTGDSLSLISTSIANTPDGQAPAFPMATIGQSNGNRRNSEANYIDDERIVDTLKSFGLNMNRTESQDEAEELCQNLLIVLFTIMWKGVEGSGKEAWKVLTVTHSFFSFLFIDID